MDSTKSVQMLICYIDVNFQKMPIFFGIIKVAKVGNTVPNSPSYYQEVHLNKLRCTQRENQIGQLMIIDLLAKLITDHLEYGLS